MSNIAKQLNEVLKENHVDKNEISKVKKFIEASRQYEILLESGLIQRRGNNLLPKERTYNSGLRFNRI